MLSTRSQAVQPESDDLPATLNQQVGGNPMQHSSFDRKLF